MQELQYTERQQRFNDFLKTLEDKDDKIKRLALMYLTGYKRNKKPYSIRELAIYWGVDEETIRDILIEILPKL
jgi:DNA-directed RNA polymerase sigma subunit (sigma70/sigma32)